jgi:hypothetical protein
MVLCVCARSVHCFGPTTWFLHPCLLPPTCTPAAATAVVLLRTAVCLPAATVNTDIALPHGKPQEPLLRLLPCNKAHGADGLAPILAPCATFVPLLCSPVRAGRSTIAKHMCIPLTEHTEKLLILERIMCAVAMLPRHMSARACQCYQHCSALPSSEWQKVHTLSKTYSLC